MLETLATSIAILGGSLLTIWPRERASAVAFGLFLIAWAALVIPIDAGSGLIQLGSGAAVALIVGLAGPRPLAAGRRRRGASDTATRPNEPTAVVFRLMAVLMGIAAAYGLARTLPLPPGAALTAAAFCWYWAMVVALMLLTLGGDAHRPRLALPMLSLAGISFHTLLGTPSAPSVAVAGAIGAVIFALILSVGNDEDQAGAAPSAGI